MSGQVKKVVLAYSGGLDTSVIIRWLKEQYGCQVIAFAADLGQGDDLRPLPRRAKAAGADKLIIKDLREEFARDFVLPALQANAVYEGKYLLATALSRPLITRHLAIIAKQEGADAVAHGCTGKGNDQVRFEVTLAALAPHVKCLAPVREWDLKSREEEIEYAERHGIPLPIKKKSPYSLDRNLWGISIEAGPLEDPWTAPTEDAFVLTVSPERAPAKPAVVEIGFSRGTPVSLNGRRMGLVALIQNLNRIAGRHGVGRVDLVENRLVGIKSREVYESPAGTVLLAAHREVESLVLDRETMHAKELIGPRYAELVYYGLWYSPLREALDGFVRATQRAVTGTARLKLYKGSVTVLGRKSPNSLYQEKLATYTSADLFDHTAAKGFIDIWGLPLKVRALMQKARVRG